MKKELQTAEQSKADSLQSAKYTLPDAVYHRIYDRIIAQTAVGGFSFTVDSGVPAESDCYADLQDAQVRTYMSNRGYVITDPTGTTTTVDWG